MTDTPSISESFRAFLTQAPGEAQAWMEAVEKLGQTSKLDPKTRALCYLSVLAALRLSSGVPFHVGKARAAGATREEVISAILVGLPAAGNGVVEALVPALKLFEK